jgi:hypothetical protein
MPSEIPRFAYNNSGYENTVNRLFNQYLPEFVVEAAFQELFNSASSISGKWQSLLRYYDVYRSLVGKSLFNDVSYRGSQSDHHSARRWRNRRVHSIAPADVARILIILILFRSRHNVRSRCRSPRLTPCRRPPGRSRPRARRRWWARSSALTLSASECC